MFRILSTYICLKKYIKCNFWRVAIRPSYIQDARFLKVKIINVKIKQSHYKPEQALRVPGG
jgi:hypothetical protein